MSDTATIRAKLIMQYSQLYDIAQNISEKLALTSVTKTVTEVLDSFIEDAKLEHTQSYWGDAYDKGVVLYTGYLMTYAQNDGVNTGIVVSQSNGSSENGNKTQYATPSLNDFGAYSVNKYGQEWITLKNKRISEFVEEDFAFYV